MNDPLVNLGDILRDGLSAAEQAGVSQVRVEHLREEELDLLAGATLAHLRTQPGKPSHHEGWLAMSPRTAGVMPWWSAAAELTEAECHRLRSLRTGVYDLLDERKLIEKAPGQGSWVHVSPAGHGEPSEEPFAPHEDAAGDDDFGAWVLKLSPYVYDANRVFAAPNRLLQWWSVDDNERSADMRHGQPVYFWLDDGDPFRAPGIWGVGWVTGPCVSGTPDDGWLDVEAANRAKLFAVVEIHLVGAPVSRSVFLDDSRLAGAEMVLRPLAGNPALLTASQAAALAEYLPWTPELNRPLGP